MILEVRTYRTKPGKRAAFLEFFETRAVGAMRAVGMPVFGPLPDLENPDVFVWLRAFSSLEERERVKNAFYEGPVWKGELEAIAMPMLESYDVALTELADGFVNFDGSRALGI
jgi:hypothetical protein